MAASLPGFLRFRELGSRVVLTNQEGRFLVLSREEFGRVRAGTMHEDAALSAKLEAKNFLRDSYDVPQAALAQRERKTFLSYGPNLHIMVVTLRCNETCVYCHASRAPMAATHTDMSIETAEKTVDLVMRTTSPGVTIEFQGGEPLANFDVVKRVVAYAVEKNKAVGKDLEFTMVTNLSLMNEEKLAWLLEHRVQVCTSVDGPAHIHDKQRKLPGKSAYEETVRWIRRINESYEEMGLDPTLYRVEALLTTTRDTLEHWKEVVDTYVDLGCRALFLRPLDPFGFANKSQGRLAFPMDEYLEFYRSAVDYMLELNAQGVQVLERFAAIFLTKILQGIDPNYLDIRNPCGAGIGQVAYNYDGSVFTCDEGRMLSAEGDDTFLIGNVAESSYRDLMGHETVRAMAVASNLDAQPACSQCAYQPYCGVCPVYNHKTQGSLFGRMPENHLCAVHMGVQDYLFERLGEGKPEVLDTFEKWTTSRPRTHFIQTG